MGAHMKSNLKTKPYNRIEDLCFESQQRVAQGVITTVFARVESSSIRAVLGFGSFWQHFQGLKADSDIDLFILLASQPSLKILRELRESLVEQVQPLEP